MQRRTFLLNAAQVYLFIAPFTVFFFVWATGSSNNYIIAWIINMALMIFCAWLLGQKGFKDRDTNKKQLALISCFLIAPFLLLSIVGGMGVPPGTAKEWVEKASREQVRFSLLIVSGILIGIGLILLREKLRQTKGNFYAQFGFAIIIIALPIFIFITSFWHSYALEAYKIKLSSDSQKLPDWFLSFRSQVWVLTVVEVVLTYLAIAAFATALKTADWFRKVFSSIYIIICLLAFVCIISYPLYTSVGIFPDFPYYPFMVPAVPFLLTYYMGVNLLRKAGTYDFSLS